MVITERHHAFLIPKKEIVSRLSKFQSQLNKTSISAAWIDHPVDLFYLSGSSQNGTLLIPADGPPILYVKKSLHRAEAESSIRVLPYPGRKGLIKKIKQLVGSNGQIGLAFDVTPVSTYTWLTDNLESIHIRQIDVQQDDIWHFFCHHRKGFPTISSFTYNFKLWNCRQQAH